MAALAPGPRAVLDSNVLWPERLRLELADAAEAGFYTPIWSDWIVAEVWRILTVRWVAKSKDPEILGRAAKLMMRALAPRFELVRSLPAAGARPWPDLRDPDDEPIWNTAQHSRADFVVSDNVNDFPPPGPGSRRVWQGVEYLRPQEFLAAIGWPADED